jgi:type VI protein secretion system component VasF
MMQYARDLGYVSVPQRYAVPRIIHRTAKAAYPRYDRTANVPLWYARTGFFFLVLSGYVVMCVAVLFVCGWCAAVSPFAIHFALH